MDVIFILLKTEYKKKHIKRTKTNPYQIFVNDYYK